MMRSRIAAFVSRAFEKHALVTNTTTCVVLYAGGDIIEQKLQGVKWDQMRTVRMGALGVLLGPCNHYWYAGLDKVVPAATTMKNVAAKILADELIFSPFSLTTFFVSMGVMEGKSRTEIKEEMARSWLPTYIVDWTVWPAAQLINFVFVPSKYRVLYVSCCTLFWNVYLSAVKHDGVHEDTSLVVQAQPPNTATAALPSTPQPLDRRSTPTCIPTPLTNASLAPKGPILS